MSGDENHTYPGGETLDDGRFVFVELIAGDRLHGLWRGHEHGNVDRDVLITFSGYLGPELISALHCGASGIPPLLFVGPPDGHRQPARRGPGWNVAVVHEWLEGEPLSELLPLGSVDVARVGIELCDLVYSWSKTGAMTFGLRPDTIFVTGQAGSRRLAGAIPHSYLIIGHETGVFRRVFFFRAPNCVGGPLDQTLEDMVYTLGLVLWRAATGHDPFDLGDNSSPDTNMWEDRRALFTGDAELGAALERVLVFDIDERETVAQLRERLLAIATPQPGGTAPTPSTAETGRLANLE